MHAFLKISMMVIIILLYTNPTKVIAAAASAEGKTALNHGAGPVAHQHSSAPAKQTCETALKNFMGKKQTHGNEHIDKHYASSPRDDKTSYFVDSIKDKDTLIHGLGAKGGCEPLKVDPKDADVCYLICKKVKMIGLDKRIAGTTDKVAFTATPYVKMIFDKDGVKTMFPIDFSKIP